MPEYPKEVATQDDVNRVAQKLEEDRGGVSFVHDPLLDKAVRLRPGADPSAVDCSKLRTLGDLPDSELQYRVELAANILVLENNPQAEYIRPDVDLSKLTKPIVSDIRAGAAVCGKPKPSGP